MWNRPKRVHRRCSVRWTPAPDCGLAAARAKRSNTITMQWAVDARTSSTPTSLRASTSLLPRATAASTESVTRNASREARCRNAASSESWASNSVADDAGHGVAKALRASTRRWLSPALREAPPAAARTCLMRKRAVWNAISVFSPSYVTAVAASGTRTAASRALRRAQETRASALLRARWAPTVGGHARTGDIVGQELRQTAELGVPVAAACPARHLDARPGKIGGQRLEPRTCAKPVTTSHATP